MENHEELVLEIIDDIRFRIDIDSPIGYVEFMLNSRLKELSDSEMLKQYAQSSLLNSTLEVENIIDAVIAKYSTSTGVIATFLVKDNAINELVKICKLEEAEEHWKEKEEFVMDSIYECIKKNKRKKR